MNWPIQYEDAFFNIYKLPDDMYRVFNHQPRHDRGSIVVSSTCFFDKQFDMSSFSCALWHKGERKHHHPSINIFSYRRLS